MSSTDSNADSGLTVLMPAFNQAAILKQSVSEVSGYLSEHKFDYEILIVDDASMDDTASIAQTLATVNPHVRFIRHARNQGPCSGLKSGPTHARKPWLLLLPADLVIPLRDIDALWQAREESDIVLGYIAQRQARDVARRVQSQAYTAIVNALFGLELKQVNFVALYRTALLRDLPLTTSGAALHAEILVRAARAGSVIRQVGLGYESRKGGAASGNKPRVIIKTLYEVLRLRGELFLNARRRTSAD